MLPLKESEMIMPYNPDGSLNKLGNHLKKIGAEYLKDNKNLGIVILSGGEGTRLGLSYPKGLFKLEGKTLFRWHLNRLESLYKKYKTPMYLFIMTSESTHSQVKDYFDDLKLDFIKDIEIFKQKSIEALDIKTKTKLYNNDQPIKSPVGNGDIFDSMKNSKNILKVDALNVISVDNALANILDEVYVGAFFENKLDILSKAIQAYPNESVGAFFKNENKIKIQEYSESKGNHTELYGNICNHMFSPKFMIKMSTIDLPLHEAQKKIPYTDENGNFVKPTTPNGIKREKFIFDSFEFSKNNSVMCVPRSMEFAPLKNSDASQFDNPKTCSEAIKKIRIEEDLVI